MALLTLVGQNVELPILQAIISLPRYGVWTADLALDVNSTAGITGAVTIQAKDGSVAFHGTAVQTRTAVSYQSVLTRIIGGAYGMATTLPPKAFQSTTVGGVIADILQAAGETLSPLSDQPTLATSLNFWVREQGVASSAMNIVLEDTGAAWRVLNDGTVFVGPETWPIFNPSVSYVIESYLPQEGRYTITMNTPQLIPGVTFNGVKTSVIEHHLEGDQLRTRFWFEINQ